MDDGLDGVMAGPRTRIWPIGPSASRMKARFADLAVVQAHCAVHADLLADGEGGLDQTVRGRRAREYAPQCLRDGGDAGLVVAAEDCYTVRANDAVLDDGCHADARVTVSMWQERTRRFDPGSPARVAIRLPVCRRQPVRRRCQTRRRSRAPPVRV